MKTTIATTLLVSLLTTAPGVLAALRPVPCGSNNRRFGNRIKGLSNTTSAGISGADMNTTKSSGREQFCCTENCAWCPYPRIYCEDWARCTTEFPVCLTL